MKSRRQAKEPEPSRLKLLFVDDGSLLSPLLMQALGDADFRVEVAASPARALADTRGKRHDAVLINADLEHIDAYALSLALRGQGFARVISIIKAEVSDQDCLTAWRAGATDCVSRNMPFDAFVQRLVAQVTGAKVRAAGLLSPVTAALPTGAGVLTLTLVPVAVMVDDRPLSLTRIEERLFGRLSSARGAAVPINELIATAWPARHVPPATLHVHLHQLRRKLAKLGLTIERVGAAGYRFS
jgi:DNA-binding response OmpR family regulator